MLPIHHRFLLVVFSLFATHTTTQAQVFIITYIAGNGIQFNSGNGGPALNSGVNWPLGVATDSSGNIFIGETQHNVRKINSAGIISNFAGDITATTSGDGGPATAANLSAPWGVATDKWGNVIICDRQKSVVRRVATTGIITTIAGTGTAGYSGDGGPATAAAINGSMHACTDTAGNIYLSDELNHCVRKIDPSGIITTIIGTGTPGYSGDGGPASTAQLHNPIASVCDAAGDIFVAEKSNHVIRKVTNTGYISTYAGSGYGSGTPFGGYSGDGGPATAARLNSPYGLALDASGNLYIADYGNYRIRKVAPSGIISTFAGNGLSGAYSGNGGPATAASLVQLSGLAIDVSGNLYIANAGGNRVLKVSPNRRPIVTNGTRQQVFLCQNAGNSSLDAALSVLDSDATQPLVWAVSAAPLHGTLSGLSAVAIATGGVVRPTGVSYTPNTGYLGLDSCRILVHDGIDTALVTLLFTISAVPATGTITGPDSVCVGATITLTNATPGGVWSTRYNFATVSAAGVVTGIRAGTDTVFYSITIGGCTGRAAKAIHILPQVAPNIQIATNTDVYCAGQPVLLVANTTNAGTSPSYTWTVNGTLVSTASTYSYIPADGDIVSCSLQSALACSTPVSDSDTLRLTDNATPTLAITCLPGNTICTGHMATFTPVSTFGGTTPTYLWQINGQYMSTGPTYAYVPENKDVIDAILVSNYPCLLSDSARSNAVTITHALQCLQIHDVLTPNGDGVNDTWVIEGLQPYPANTVQIMGKWGTMLYETTGYSNNWDGTSKTGERLPDGTYYYIIKLNAENVDGGENEFIGSLLLKR